MLWHTSISTQRPTPRGEVAVIVVGQPNDVTVDDMYIQEPGRWRS